MTQVFATWDDILAREIENYLRLKKHSFTQQDTITQVDSGTIYSEILSNLKAYLSCLYLPGELESINNIKHLCENICTKNKAANEQLENERLKNNQNENMFLREKQTLDIELTSVKEQNEKLISEINQKNKQNESERNLQIQEIAALNEKLQNNYELINQLKNEMSECKKKVLEESNTNKDLIANVERLENVNRETLVLLNSKEVEKQMINDEIIIKESIIHDLQVKNDECEKKIAYQNDTLNTIKLQCENEIAHVKQDFSNQARELNVKIEHCEQEKLKIIAECEKEIIKRNQLEKKLASFIDIEFVKLKSFKLSRIQSSQDQENLSLDKKDFSTFIESFVYWVSASFIEFYQAIENNIEIESKRKRRKKNDN